MSKRFYVCPVREISTDPDDPTDVSWRPVVFKYLAGRPGSANIAAQTQLGPNAWALVKLDFLDNQNHLFPSQDAEIDDVPDITTDDVLPAAARSKMQGIFNKYGVPGTVRASEPLRGLLGRIARQANPGFAEDNWF